MTSKNFKGDPFFLEDALVDVEDALICPGFVDTHVHYVQDRDRRRLRLAADRLARQLHLRRGAAYLLKECPPEQSSAPAT